MKVGFDGGIKLEFHGAKVTSDGGLLAYRDLDDAVELFDSVSTVFKINAQTVTSGMLYLLCCVSLYTAVSQVMKM